MLYCVSFARSCFPQCPARLFTMKFKSLFSFVFGLAFSTLPVSQAAELNPIQQGQKEFEGGAFWAARNSLTKALELGLQPYTAYLWRGAANAELKDYSKALADFSSASQLRSKEPEPFRRRAYVFLRQRDYRSATAAFERAAALGPHNYTHCNSLAWILATAPDASVRNGTRAVSLAKEGCELTKWKDPSYLDTLAAAYAETGKFEEALRWQTKAVEMVDHPPWDRTNARKPLHAHLKLIRNKEPIRDAQ